MFTTTIIVVVVLTALIFTLTFIAFSSFLKAERQAIANGKRDEEIRAEMAKEKKKSSKVINILTNIINYILITVFAAATFLAITFKVSGQQFTWGEHTALVIASDSMNGFNNETYQQELLEFKPDAEQQQFDVGAILDFTIVAADDELILFDVYGYQLHDGKIITHRYIGQTNDGRYIFRGDNTGGRDAYVDRSQIILHYSGMKINHIGLFVLFSQSGFGLYALISVIIVYILADIFVYKYEKEIKKRINTLKDKKAIDSLYTLKHSKLQKLTIKFKRGTQNED